MRREKKKIEKKVSRSNFCFKERRSLSLSSIVLRACESLNELTCQKRNILLENCLNLSCSKSFKKMLVNEYAFSYKICLNTISIFS